MWAFSRFVRYFDAVARDGSTRRAGERLHVSASSVDRQILQVEEILGVPLFERLSRGLKLTAAGELVLVALRRWKSELATLESRIEDLKGMRRGSVALATVEGAASDFLVEALAAFHARFPEVDYRIRVEAAHRVTELVRAGEVDFGLGVNPQRVPGIEVLALRTFRLGAVVAPGHPLWGQPTVRLSQCMPYRLVVAGPGLELRSVVDAVLSRVSARPALVVEANSIQLMKELVMRGMGVGLMTELDVSNEVRRGELHYAALGERGVPHSQLALCVLTERQLSIPAGRLVGEIRDRLAQRMEGKRA